MVLNESMQMELEYVFAMILYGSFVAFCYHIILFFRTLFYHAKEVVDAQDILFLAGAGFFFFFVVYEKNDGILRWYAFVGFLVGIYFYVISLAKILEFIRKRLLQKLGKPFKINLMSQMWQNRKNREKGRVLEREGCGQKSESKTETKKKKWS